MKYVSATVDRPAAGDRGSNREGEGWIFKAWLGCPKGKKSPETGFTSPGALEGLSAHPRPGYPLVGLRPRRARLRFTRPRGCIASLADTQEQAKRQDSKVVVVTEVGQGVA